MSIKEGDVWFAKFPLEEDDSKFLSRPIIILNVERLEVLVAPRVIIHSSLLSVENPLLVGVRCPAWPEAAMDGGSPKISLYDASNVNDNLFKSKTAPNFISKSSPNSPLT